MSFVHHEFFWSRINHVSTFRSQDFLFTHCQNSIYSLYIACFPTKMVPAIVRCKQTTLPALESRPRSMSIFSSIFVFVLISFNANVKIPFEAGSFSKGIMDKEQEIEQQAPIKGISLITSFFAVEMNSEELHQHAHRPEIEAALLVNLQNPHFRQVVVVLDSVTDRTINCQALSNTLLCDKITSRGAFHWSLRATRLIRRCLSSNVLNFEKTRSYPVSQLTLKCFITQSIILPSHRTR